MIETTYQENTILLQFAVWVYVLGHEVSDFDNNQTWQNVQQSRIRLVHCCKKLHRE